MLHMRTKESDEDVLRIVIVYQWRILTTFSEHWAVVLFVLPLGGKVRGIALP